MSRLLMMALAAAFCSCLPDRSVSADAAAPDAYQAFPGRPQAPKAPMVGDAGKWVPLAVFRDKTLILNFWATWCAPCVTELPSLDRLAKALPAGKVVVIGVTEDAGGLAAAKPFLERLGLSTMLVFADPGQRLQRAFSVRGLPTTFIIRPDGTVHGRVEGPMDWDRTEVQEFILSVR